ncbi:MAG: hypothetical protein ACOCQG_04535 [Candidatus Nanoarchaeia archaeon]
MQKKNYKFFSLVFFLTGGIILLCSKITITGAVIGLPDFRSNFTSLLGILLVATSALIYAEGRLEDLFTHNYGKDKYYQGLKQHLQKEYEEKGPEKEREVFISRKAEKATHKDHYIREHLGTYIKEIDKIIENPLERQQELIGDFRISPQGHKKERIAWRYEVDDKGTEKIFIDDLLYHIDDKDYKNKWNKKAANFRIRGTDYDDHKPYTGL